MTIDFRQKPYYHLGYPKASTTAMTTYALYSLHHDCFVYLDSNLDMMKQLQILLNPKLVLFIYELMLPLASLQLENTISNYNATCWTLDDYMARPSTQRMMHHYVHVDRIDCREVNMLEQISGLKQIPCQAEQDPRLAHLIEWAYFVAHVIKKIKQVEHPADEIVSRIMLADNFHARSGLLDQDVYVTYSKVYKLLAEHEDVSECTQAIQALMRQYTELFPWDQRQCLTL